jgi:hypothetical protein
MLSEHGVVDFGEEEIQPHPRDTGKRIIFGVPPQIFASRNLMPVFYGWDN